MRPLQLVPIVTAAIDLALVAASSGAVQPVPRLPGSQPELITVGSDAACDFESLQVALDAASTNSNGTSNDFIFVAKNHDDADDGVPVLSQDISIHGGFPSCADLTPSGSTTVSGGGPVMTIASAPGSPHTVVLRDLRITGGSSPGNGGGLALSGPTTLILEGDTAITLNEAAAAGGGIFVNGDHGAHLELRDSASVSLNEAEHGGGIFCTAIAEAEALVELGESAAVFLNQATRTADGDGGGIVVTTGCDLLSRAGGLFAGILLNEAADQGGGLVVDNGAQADLIGGTSHPAILNDNVARQGGGAYVDNDGSRLDTLNAWIVGNLAKEDGGGAFVNDGGVLVMDRTLAADCHDPVRCSRLAMNHAGEPGSRGRGGGVFVDGDNNCDGGPSGSICPRGTADFGRTYIEENSVEDHPESRGSVGMALDHTYRLGGARIRLLGSVVARNQNGSEVLFSSDELFIEYSTITANSNNLRVVTLRIDDPPTFPGISAFSRLILSHSTIWEDVDTLHLIQDGTPAFPDPHELRDSFATCFNGESESLIEAVNDPDCCFEFIGPPLDVDPLFVDAPGGDFHLSELSPLIDLCDDESPPQVSDVELDPRGVDDPSTVDVGGTFDVGADEFVPPDPEGSIFSDGFESGNTTAWSIAL